VIQNDRVIHEAYPNGGSRDAISPSFSVTKSFVSTLIGLAVEDGTIGSLDDAVIRVLVNPPGSWRHFGDGDLLELPKMKSHVGRC
jgi:CubicO group peptidase (beta-lactamase class C family)